MVVALQVTPPHAAYKQGMRVMTERSHLLLIRPKAQSEAFLADCETRLGRQIDAVISPIIDIRPLGGIPDLDGFGTVVFSSANGVRKVSDLSLIHI